MKCLLHRKAVVFVGVPVRAGDRHPLASTASPEYVHVGERKQDGKVSSYTVTVLERTSSIVTGELNLPATRACPFPSGAEGSHWLRSTNDVNEGESHASAASSRSRPWLVLRLNRSLLERVLLLLLLPWRPGNPRCCGLKKM